jgi:stage II sporulation protein D
MDFLARRDQLRNLGGSAEGFRVTPVTGVTRVVSVITLVLGLAVALVGLPVPGQASAWASENYPVPKSGVFRLSGLGYGHGIGMSQFGAQGMGLLGKSYRQIMHFYFPGTTFAHASNKPVRVLVSGLTHYSNGRGYVEVQPRRHLQLVSGDTSVQLPKTVDGSSVSSFRVVNHGGLLRVIADTAGKSHTVAGHLTGTARFLTTGTRATSRVSLTSTSGSKETFRGFFDVKRSGSGVIPVSSVLLEDYLRSVVAHEVPSSWTAAALRAQAVAARSYVLVARSTARAAGRAYDICDTSSCQAYGPVSMESDPETAAVEATAGQYLESGGQPALTMFSSANGGYTVAAGRSYLIAQPDPYDGVVQGAANWGHSWTANVRATTLESAWPQIGTLQSIKVLSRDGNGQWGGRVLSVAVVGSQQTVSVSGDDFRWAAGLKSSWWSITNVTPTSKAAPRDVHSKPQDQGLRMRWKPPNTKLRVRGYEVMVAPGGHSYRVKAAQHKLSIHGLTNGREYHARVRAIYKHGRGAATPSAAVVPVSQMSYFQPLSVQRLLVEQHNVGPSVRILHVLGKHRAPGWGTRAVALRISATSHVQPGRVLAWPTGHQKNQLVAGTFPAGSVTNGMVIVPVGKHGTISLRTTAATSGLTVHLVGYFGASAVSADQFRAVSAQRVVSSLSSKGWVGGRLRAGKADSVRIAGRGSVPDHARTVLVNVALVRPTVAATLNLSKPGTAFTYGSAVHAARSAINCSTALVRLDADGRLPLRLTDGRADVAIDVLGWFRPQNGDRTGRYKTVAPAAVVGNQASTLAAGDSTTVDVTGDDTQVPPRASAVALQVLARGEGTPGSVAVTPAPTTAWNRSVLNFGSKGVNRNLVVVPVGPGGTITVSAKGASADVSVSVVGWYS